MKKLLCIMLILALLVSTATIAMAKGEDDKAVMKKEYSKTLVKNGEIKSLDKKIKEYYDTNKDKLVDLSKLKDADSIEADKVLEQIKQDVAGFVPTSGEIGTRDLGSGDPSGTNNIDYTYFENGDAILVHSGFCIYGYYRHTGTYDQSMGAFVSAQLTDSGNGTGVIWESKSWYRNNYDEAVGVAVDYYQSNRQTVIANVMSYLRAQLGKPYSLLPGYNVRDQWYCSKLPWVGWKEKSGMDISNAGWIIGMCWPDDIYNDGDTFVFATGN